jgi:hypothetical protein
MTKKNNDAPEKGKIEFDGLPAEIQDYIKNRELKRQEYKWEPLKTLAKTQKT